MSGYDASWASETVEVRTKKTMGHGARKDILRQVTSACLEELRKNKKKYGKGSRKLAIKNLETSLRLFRNGKGWVQGTEEDTEEGTERPTFCAIGAIHRADGQAEHLARLAVDLAAGQLFPDRAMTGFDSDVEDAVYCGQAGDDEPGLVRMPDVVEFNDDNETTYPDVAKVFRRGIKILEDL